MSLKDINVENSVKELEKLKALLELSILKTASTCENQGEIDELLLKTTLKNNYGTSNIIYISKEWQEGSVEYKRDNLNSKYVKISDNTTAR